LVSLKQNEDFQIDMCNILFGIWFLKKQKED